MGMDRNTVIGFVLLALLFFGYFYYNSKGQVALEKERQHTQDSLNKLKPLVDTVLAKADSARVDSTLKLKALGSILQDTSGKEQLITVENEVLKIIFTNKGAQPKTVELKNFKSFDGQSLLLANGKFNKISYRINSGNNNAIETSDVLFHQSSLTKGSDGSQTLIYTLPNAQGQSVEHRYTLPSNNYLVDFTISMQGADQLVSQNTINLNWQVQAPQLEKDIVHEKQQSHICYSIDGDYDFENLGTGSTDKKFEKPLDWISVKQQFFATSLLAKNKFTSAGIQWEVPSDTNNHVIAQAISTLKLKTTGSNTSIPLQLFYGPLDYKILKSYGNGMHNIVPLGNGMFAFVKYINRGFIMPVFNYMGSKFASFGLVIALLTIIIRLLISPLTYQSYLSGAKMKLLKPEVDTLKAKYGEDKQAIGMEQMKLFKAAGVNPLGGCIPALLQIPIFFALFNFFNSNIALRGQSFWWSKDLSSYDTIYNLPFAIPIYGNHISLFTIFAVFTSLLISLYGMSNMQDNSNPVMKYMPFIFPVILLGVFNNQPSALTWYYTVSNVITLLIQFVIQKYIIDHEKILAQLELNKKKPQTKSKLALKIEAMQENNKKIQNMQQKAGKKTK